MFTKCNEERSRLCSGIIAVLHLITPFRNDQMQRARGNFQRKNPLYSSLCSYQFSPIRSRCSKMLSECTVEDETRRGKFIRRPAKVHYAISPQGANLHRRSRNSRQVRRGLPTRTLQRRRTWLACRVPPPARAQSVPHLVERNSYASWLAWNSVARPPLSGWSSFARDRNALRTSRLLRTLSVAWAIPSAAQALFVRALSTWIAFACKVKATVPMAATPPRAVARADAERAPT